MICKIMCLATATFDSRNLGTLYIRRRSQLLREHTKVEVRDSCQGQVIFLLDYKMLNAIYRALDTHYEGGVGFISQLHHFPERVTSFGRHGRVDQVKDVLLSPHLRNRDHHLLESAVRKQYLKVRSQLLQKRYGVSCDQGQSSRTMSIRSNSRISESPENYRFPPESRPATTPNSEQGEVVPTKQADASRAIVGGTTIAENYAFVGVHHIFDQHTHAVTMVKFANNDRSKLCCASFDGTVSICNVTASPPVVDVVFRGHTKGVTGDFYLYNYISGLMRRSHNRLGGQSSISASHPGRACDWSVSNDLVVSCSLDGTIFLWDVASRRCLRVVRDQVAGAELLSCVFQPANNNMVIVSFRKDITFSGYLTHTCNHMLKNSCVESLEEKDHKGDKERDERNITESEQVRGEEWWKERGRWSHFTSKLQVGTVGDDRDDDPKRTILTEADRLAIRAGWWRSLTFPPGSTPKGGPVNSGGGFWPLLASLAAISSGRETTRVVDKEGTLQVRRKFAIRHENYLVRSTFLSGSEDSCVYFLDIERKGKPCVNTLQGHACPVLGVSFNYDESLLATSDYQGLVIVWKREKRSGGAM
uniref:WD repeat-containing protein 13 n=1 Tax=Timema douglasi TaxID=61478 RepID=A0A7R8ZCI0_TIMDO|nr:unnamed protein product [Timema douglasi]